MNSDDCPRDATGVEPNRLIADVYGRYGTLVYGLAYRLMRSSADAEDVTQDVFAGLPRALASYRASGSFEGWLRRVTTRVALMHLRRMRSRREHALALAADVADTSDARVAHIGLSAAIDQLPEDFRTVFILKEVEGYSHDEIAALLGITANVSAVRLHRARKALRLQLGESNDVPSPD